MCITVKQMMQIEENGHQMGFLRKFMMENAGAGATKRLVEKFTTVKSKNILVFAGLGNNGGDGLVIARHLAGYGSNVTVFLLGEADNIRSEECSWNWSLLEKMKSVKLLTVGNLEDLNNLKFKTAFIKKKYHNQEDEQKILSSHGKLFCKNNRVDALKDAINEDIEVAIFDDGLQDKILDYNITFVCFNIQTWVGNSFCIPSGPLREDLKSIKKYDAVFLNGNGENTIEIENILKNIKPSLEIFIFIDCKSLAKIKFLMY